MKLILFLVLLSACGGPDDSCRPSSMCPGANTPPYYVASKTLSAFVCKCGPGVLMGFDVERTDPNTKLDPAYCDQVGETWNKAVRAAGGSCTP